jgi:hypothetical protein
MSKLKVNMVYWVRRDDPNHFGDPVPDLADRLREFDFIPRVGDYIDTEDDLNEVKEVRFNLVKGEGEGEAPYGSVDIFIH